MTRLLLLLGLIASQASAAISPTPDGARFVTEDIARFWAAWDADGGPPSAATLQRLYLDPGSPGLRDFVDLRIGDAAQLARTVKPAAGYYAAIRPATLEVEAQLPAMRAAFARLEAEYPAAVFPDVYFLIGRLNSGGTLSERALLIGTEMFGRAPGVSLDGLSAWHQAVIGASADLPHIVAHELVHYQQPRETRQPTLLVGALREGVADWLAERISGKHINATAHRYGLAHECALWQEFAPRMAGTDYTGFLYGGAEDGGRPADLGYFIGYRIAAAYAASRPADATGELLADLLGARAADAILADSGYAPCGR